MQSTSLTLKKDYLTINLVHPDDPNHTLPLTFEYDDKNVLMFAEKMKTSVKAIEEAEGKMLKAESDNDYMDYVNEALQDFYDSLFGEGTYEKLKLIQTSVANRRSLVGDLIRTITSMLYKLREEQEEKEADFYSIGE